MARTKKKNTLEKKHIETAIKNKDLKTIIEYSTQHQSKRCSYSFCDQLKTMNESDMAAMLNSLIKIMMEYIEKYLDKKGIIDWVSAEPEHCEMAGQLIQASIDIALSCVQCNLTPQHRVDLARLAVLLHGIMLPMPNSLENVKNSIAQFCEKLFLTDQFERGELFLSNVVIYLLRKTLVKKALKADVKRLYAIRKVLKTVVEMNDAPKGEIWELFKKIVVSNTYLSILEGQKLIGLVLVMDIDHMAELHKAIKSTLPVMNIKNATAYGRVYFEAWCYSIKSSKQEFKNVFEITCLQDFIVTGILSQQKFTLALVHKVLSQFHLAKKETDVAKMLYNIYQPLLYRYLKNPDGLIRANAAYLFFNIFPLEDPEATIVHNSNELNDQLLLIRELLVDEFPIVRITALIGICIAMSLNWEVFPEEIIKTIFKIIVNDLACDSTTPEIRLCVVKGMKCMLENPLTLKVLVAILPKIRGIFHDVNENARIAFCGLLLRVKKIAAIKYYDIVSKNHLLARLEEDNHPVKKQIANLLHNSYFPRNNDTKIWLGRCLDLIRTDRKAARVFFSYSNNHISLELAVKFILQATRAVLIYKKGRTDSINMLEMHEKENIQSLSDYLTNIENAAGFNNLHLVSSLMEVLAIIWLSLKGDMDKTENKCHVKMFVARIAQPMSDLSLYYQETNAVWESVAYFASFLPPAKVPVLGALTFSKMKALPPDASEDEYINLIQCLMNHHQASEVLILIKSWIDSGFSNANASPLPKKKRRKSKNSENVLLDEPKPNLANRMLNTILSVKNLQTAVFMHEEYTKILKEMLYFVEDIKKKMVRNQAKNMKKEEAEFLYLLLCNLTRISVFLHEQNSDTDVDFLKDIVKWANQELVKHLRPHRKDDHFSFLVFSLCQDLCKVIADVTALGFCDPNNCEYLEFFINILSTGVGHKFALITSRFLFKYAASAQFLYSVHENTTMLHHLLCYLCKVFDCFNDEVVIQEIPPMELSEIELTLANMMQVVYNCLLILNDSASEVFRSIIGIILDSTTTRTDEIVEEMAEDPFDRLSFPPSGAFFMAIVKRKTALTITYLKFITEMCKNCSSRNVSTWIGYWLITYNILHGKSVSRPIIREASTLVTLLETFFKELYPAMDCDSESQEPTESVPAQLFQRHCHEELIKLKCRLKRKFSTAKCNKK